MKIITAAFLFLIFAFSSPAQIVRVHKTAYNFDSVAGKPAANVSVPANAWTDVFTLGLIPSEPGGQWDLDAKVQIESGTINLLQSCTFQFVVRDPQGVLVETLDESAESKGAILTLKNYTSVYLGGRYLHASATGMSAVLRVSCTTAHTVTPNGTWIRAEYRK